MNNSDWRELLNQASQKSITNSLGKESSDENELHPGLALSPDVIASGWLGTEGATESQLQAVESRLDITLPASYRNFLSVTNGWNNWGINFPSLRPANKISWFRDEYQDVIDDWVDASYVESHDGPPPISDENYFIYGETQDSYCIRVKYLQSALQISAYSGGDVMLLNPEISVEGEWEAWFFSSELGGAWRYRTFSEMIKSQGLVDDWF